MCCRGRLSLELPAGRLVSITVVRHGYRVPALEAPVVVRGGRVAVELEALLVAVLHGFDRQRLLLLSGNTICMTDCYLI